MKHESILRALEELRLRLGAAAFVVRDYWSADLFATGIASLNDPDRLVYLSTFGTRQNRYDVSLELPSGEANPLPYTPAGEWTDVGVEELTMLVRRHLRLA
ncbi:MAG TPA: hypothetical protein VGB24_07795 [Longimicrobium sp.]|uniref:hypothetical protein n=1 Tax=Longimicrobium sp. TaxID=2029185 RepID=UPI002EDA6F6B